ncbi:MAG: Pycsar system effector family protein [Bacteroidota bacterium]
MKISPDMEHPSSQPTHKELVASVESRPLVEAVVAYCSHILKEELPSEMVYHNYKHTRNVVKGVIKISLDEGLNADDLETLIIAAWFHDVGFKETYDGHEEEGIRMANTFLREKQLEEEKIEKIQACIAVTKREAVPTDLLEKIIKDADLFHLSKDSYFKRIQALRKEWEAHLGKTYSDIEWYEENIHFLRKHNFHTKYGEKVLEENKQQNLTKMEGMLKELSKEQDKQLMKSMHISAQELKELKKKLQKVEGRPERGIETMFRLTSKNHISLSAIADQKASMMIQVNSIIITILLGALVPKLDSNPHLLIPTFFMLMVNLLSIVFSALATRPNITSGVFTAESIKAKNTNLLFFGNFHKMNRDEYKWGMTEMMDDSEYLYSSLIDDIYFLGVVLGKKYRLLRISYTVFMFGIIASVITFLIVNLVYLG